MDVLEPFGFVLFYFLFSAFPLFFKEFLGTFLVCIYVEWKQKKVGNEAVSYKVATFWEYRSLLESTVLVKDRFALFLYQKENFSTLLVSFFSFTLFIYKKGSLYVFKEMSHKKSRTKGLLWIKENDDVYIYIYIYMYTICYMDSGMRRCVFQCQIPQLSKD